MTEERIKLAEAMNVFDFAFNRERCPDDWTDDQVWEMCRFNPFQDANDTEALIRWLNGQGFEPRINFWVSHAEVRLDHNGHPDGPKIHRWDGQNWKTGVCELALKVIQ